MKDIIENKIREQADEIIAALSAGHTLESSEKAWERMKKHFRTGEVNEDLLELADCCSIHSSMEQVNRYMKTWRALRIDAVVKVETQYVITDRVLVSPAGFHPSEKIFFKNEIFIQTNKLPDFLGGGLMVFDVTKTK